MNCPTTCMECMKVFAIDDCCRDPEGNFFCKPCRRRALQAQLDGLRGPSLPDLLKEMFKDHEGEKQGDSH